MKLIDPSTSHKDSWLATIAECEQESLGLSGPGNGVLMTTQCDPRDIDTYIRLSTDFSQGKNLPEGWVACSNFWFVDEDQFIGAANFRHELNDALREFGGHIGYFIRPSKRNQGYGTKMLELILQRIRETTELSKVMITCSDTNYGSRRVIEKNNGVFEGYSNHEGGKTRKYWINL